MIYYTMAKLDIQQALYDWNPWFSGEFPLELAGIPRDYNLLQPIWQWLLFHTHYV